MSPKKSRILFTKFPFLYPDSRIRDNPLPYGFGFGCDDGWYKILFRLCNTIQCELEKSPKEIRANFKVVQIKEKFGGLRFYVHGCTEGIAKAIDKAEWESLDTCEMCGKNGFQSSLGGFWIKTLCGRCEKDSGRKRAKSDRRRKRTEVVVIKTYEE